MAPVAADPESLALYTLADRIAQSDITVLINGPTGTGKEVLARAIHLGSARADGPFIAINCAALPETMLEAMLFGHQKGAFTGASSGGRDSSARPNGGTLLLDEIAEMPLHAAGQAAARLAGARSRADRRDHPGKDRRPRHRLRQPRPAGTKSPQAGSAPISITACRCSRSPPVAGRPPRSDIPALAAR